MRLGQLARKLSLRPAQIVEFLAQQNIQIEEGSNTRMEDDHVVLVVKQYAPENLVSIVAEIDEVDQREEEIVPTEQPVSEILVPQVEVTEVQPVGDPEVIRVQKIELSGLKVLGKIELPEPKKKEPAPEQIEEPHTLDDQPAAKQQGKPQKHARKAVHQKRERQKQGEWKNPLELQREREAREAEEKRRLALEREKERRKKHYEQKVKIIAQPKRVKPVKDEPQLSVKSTKTQPTTWLGKFWKWLRPD